MSQSAAAKQQLQDAFELFNLASEQLTGSWHGLQQQVVSLTGELTAARSERLQLLDEIRTLQQEVSRAQRLSSMGEMTARLAHQIRTPLSTSLLYASQLCDPHLGENRHRQFVSQLLDGLRHLDRMVNDMLSFACGGQAGEEAVDIIELLSQVEDSLSPQIETRKASWTVSADDGLLLRVQRDVLASALGNLALNALCAGGTGACIEWRARRINGQLELALKDNGSGIPVELQEKIFEPFFTTRTNGTGLGLAVVRAVVSAHGGKVELDTKYRHGARFVLYFPIGEAQQALPSELLNQQRKAANADSRCE